MINKNWRKMTASCDLWSPLPCAKIWLRNMHSFLFRSAFNDFCGDICWYGCLCLSELTLQREAKPIKCTRTGCVAKLCSWMWFKSIHSRFTCGETSLLVEGLSSKICQGSYWIFRDLKLKAPRSLMCCMLNTFLVSSWIVANISEPSHPLFSIPL